MKENLPREVSEALKHPVAIWGAGVSGMAVAELLKGLEVEYIIYDEKAGEDYERDFTLGNAQKHQLVIYSPGFDPKKHAWFQRAEQANLLVLGEMDFAALFWKGKVLGVTGTNGKTTLTSFLCLALKREGKKAVVAGNIGTPLSRIVLESNFSDIIAVCEISSFQAEGIRYLGLDSLIWTNFCEDHLNRYDSMQDYYDAKALLIRRLKEKKLIVGKGIRDHADRFSAPLPVFTKEVFVNDESISMIPQDSVFQTFPQRENYLLAKCYWDLEGYSDSALKGAAQNFILPSHRLQEIGEFQGVRFWNDSKATNFASTIAALKAFSGPVQWIGGGVYKRGNLEAFGAEIASHIRKAYLIGEVAPQLAQVLARNGASFEVFEKFQDAVYAAYNEANAPDDILLSPGFSSFDMFDGYMHRGNSFLNAFLSLKSSKLRANSQ